MTAREARVDRETLDLLRGRSLLAAQGTAGTELPAEPVHSTKSYRSRYRGCLLAGAIGDALGRPGEGLPPHLIRERYGSLTDFHPWPGWESGPIGTITDDTQLTRCVAESYLEEGRLDPEAVARRLVAWLPEARGKGRACTTAVLRLKDGVPWHEAGVESAGNGATMRSAPVGLANPFDLDGLRRDAALHTVVTHADEMAVASSVALAFGCARHLHVRTGELDPEAFLEEVVGAIQGVPDSGHQERRPEAGPESVRLAERLAELPALLDGEPGEVFGYLYNGAFVLESLPAAFWCFLRSPEEPERVLVTAADGGYDADTVASMAGNLVGAYRGEEALPDRWLEELEYREELRALADGLMALAGLAQEP